MSERSVILGKVSGHLFAQKADGKLIELHEGDRLDLSL